LKLDFMDPLLTAVSAIFLGSPLVRLLVGAGEDGADGLRVRTQAWLEAERHKRIVGTIHRQITHHRQELQGLQDEEKVIRHRVADLRAQEAKLNASEKSIAERKAHADKQLEEFEKVRRGAFFETQKLLDEIFKKYTQGTLEEFQVRRKQEQEELVAMRGELRTLKAEVEKEGAKTKHANETLEAERSRVQDLVRQNAELRTDNQQLLRALPDRAKEADTD